MSKGLMEIVDATFESTVLKAEKPVLVDFWAPWCGPCRAIGPLVDEMAEKFGSRMTFAKMNVDENPLTPIKYGIKAIPTLLFFKEGEIAEKITGMADRTKLETAIQKVL